MKYDFINSVDPLSLLYAKQYVSAKIHCLENIMEYTRDKEFPDFYIELPQTNNSKKITTDIPIRNIQHVVKRFLTQDNKEQLYQKQSDERDFFEKSILSNDLQTKYLSLGLLLKNIHLTDLYRIGKLIQFNIYPYSKFKVELNVKVNNKSFSDYNLFDAMCKYHKLLLDKLS